MVDLIEVTYGTLRAISFLYSDLLNARPDRLCKMLRTFSHAKCEQNAYKVRTEFLQ